MKNILISIKPQWVEKILNGEKTVEIRKTMPKCELPCKVYIYCTKDNKELRLFNQKVCASFKISRTKTYSIAQQKAYTKFIGDESQSLNGKVVGEFTLNNVEKIHCCAVPYRKTNNLNYEHFIDNGVYQLKDDDGLVFERDDTKLDTMLKNKDLKKIQLKPIDIYNYLNGYGKFYVWHIDNLKIYDKPKELSEFSSIMKRMKGKESRFTSHLLQRPPQSYCFVEELKEN